MGVAKQIELHQHLCPGCLVYSYFLPEYPLKHCKCGDPINFEPGNYQPFYLQPGDQKISSGLFTILLIIDLMIAAFFLLIGWPILAAICAALVIIALAYRLTR